MERQWIRTTTFVEKRHTRFQVKYWLETRNTPHFRRKQRSWKRLGQGNGRKVGRHEVVVQEASKGVTSGSTWDNKQVFVAVVRMSSIASVQNESLRRAHEWALCDAYALVPIVTAHAFSARHLRCWRRRHGDARAKQNRQTDVVDWLVLLLIVMLPAA